MLETENVRLNIIEMLIRQGITNPDELVATAKIIEDYIFNQSFDSK